MLCYGRGTTIAVLSQVHHMQMEDTFTLEDRGRARAINASPYFTPTAKQIYAELDRTPRPKLRRSDFVERSKYQKLEVALRDLLSLMETYE